MEELEHRQLHPLARILIAHGAAAQQQVQLLAADSLRQGLLVLLAAQVGQKIRDDQLGVARIAADVDGLLGPIRQDHHAVKLQGDGGPLILADAAIVVGLEVGKLIVLIEGVGLQVQAGGVDVSGGDLGTLLQGLAAKMGQHHALAPVADIDLVAALEGHPPLVGDEALFLRQADGLRRAEALGLAGVQERHVALAVGVDFPALRGADAVPAVLLPGEELLLQVLGLIFHAVFPPSRSR